MSAPTESQKSNVQHRHKVIQEAAKGFQSINADRKRLNKRAAEIRKRLKENSIHVKEVERAIPLLEMEPEDRNSLIDARNEVWAALEIGTQAQLWPDEDGGDPDDLRGEEPAERNVADQRCDQADERCQKGDRNDPAPEQGPGRTLIRAVTRRRLWFGASGGDDAQADQDQNMENDRQQAV